MTVYDSNGQMLFDGILPEELHMFVLAHGHKLAPNLFFIFDSIMVQDFEELCAMYVLSQVGAERTDRNAEAA